MPNEEEVNSEEKPIEEILNFDKPDFTFVPKETHEWRQRGPYCVCLSCELSHAVFIGMDKIMIGQNEKGPILVNRKEYERRNKFKEKE